MSSKFYVDIVEAKDVGMKLISYISNLAANKIKGIYFIDIEFEQFQICPIAAGFAHITVWLNPDSSIKLCVGIMQVFDSETMSIPIHLMDNVPPLYARFKLVPTSGGELETAFEKLNKE